MNLRENQWGEVDAAGRLVVPAEVAARLGFKPGEQVRIVEDGYGLHLDRPITRLAKIYIEPTSLCNLACRTCIRNVWDEPLGSMSAEVFSHILSGIKTLPSPPVVFFGGYGEPLLHPHIVEMVLQAKTAAASVELITNGTLLTRELSRQLIEAGLNTMWISLDGVSPENYADVRLGAELPTIFENISHFRSELRYAHQPIPEIGIAFVAMKRNIPDLPGLLRLSKGLGVSRYMVTNILPHTVEMCDEVLYYRSLTETAEMASPISPHLDLPRIDLNKDTRAPLYQALLGMRHFGSMSGDGPVGVNDRCPFIQKGTTVIGWDGGLSPCLPLLHNQASYLYRRERFARRYIIGNILDQSLDELWNASEYIDFRRRVQGFDFSPCTLCGGCDLSETNEEDCFGNTFPTCGGCLWAQGVIRCP